jgi:hypothetical protein
MEQEKQINFWKLRMIIGVVALIVVWVLFFYYRMYNQMTYILWGSFTVYSLFAYIYIPLKRINDIRSGNSKR